jgi:porphobilinogen synthase
MAAVAMAAAGVSSQAASIGSSHEGLRRVAPAFGASAAVPVASRCKVQRRVSVQAIAEPPTKSVKTIEECEADVVAGNAPAAPPVPAKAKAPEGTPKISPLVRARVLHCCIVGQGTDSSKTKGLL